MAKDKKKNYFSHSAIEQFRTCGEMYKLYRIERLRTTHYRSAFLFGSAIDSAVEAIFLKYKKDLTEEETSKVSAGSLALFAQAMCSFKNNHGDVIKDAARSTQIKYSAQDFQVELLNEEDYETIEAEAELKDIEIPQEEIPQFVEQCFGVLKMGKALSAEEHTIYNLINWLSLYRKGEILLPEITQWAEDNIKEVHSMQHKIYLEDDEDIFTGYVDLVATLKDGIKRVIDFKTTAVKYKEGDADTSQQLTIYAEHMQIDRVAFLAFEKNIRKREPRTRFAFIEGITTETQKDEVFQGITESIEEIKKKQFDKNEKSCYNYGKCDYFNLCHKNSLKGLKVLEYKSKKED